MSEGRIVKDHMTIEELRGYFKEVNEEMTKYIGWAEGTKLAASPADKAEASWMIYLLDHIRNLYHLTEETIIYIKTHQDSLEKLPLTIKEFEMRKPVLDFIAETEMTEKSKLESSDDEQ